ncbi:bifunctional tRNA (5-methylaminomethyl-2-thiouridine)(34)-methyltransferase MnmD/FAD-dependent 5-carboxymethylaminomethyl-2-thiouridine(34) oxidoreductase MnmC [Chromatiaceae bacterium AAb-1]|nr:bifunctional tRNA (5-methylaminomethyl-2-thiouridine)(34)-methyltransferase MnmD/FAD-dependent 5-carboxymethylaminomethyl-2-thiouridine(34) oxidoreductase MnmC [Chromatiaceae bacterium AAb-1]
MHRLSNARIHFNEQGTPVASDFDDIYFSNDGGLAETDYVFLQQNGLPERWVSHADAAFQIMETGFGTGANFLLTWQYFRQFRQQYPAAPCKRLYFSSFEKFPLTRADLTQALQAHPQLAEQCNALLAAYPAATPGCHRLSFDNHSVILDLWLGDVNQLLPSVPVSRVDAIYLDGFAPGKNPDMWQPELFRQLSLRSTSGTTLSTFTAAGFVKRGLQDAGFSVSKTKGFGRKRDMLTAAFNTAQPHLAVTDKPAAVTIIGGGIAAICSALSLLRRDIAVTLLCADNDVALQASHNHQGAVYPNLHSTMTADSLLHCQAFYFARQCYSYYRQTGFEFGLDWCGLLHLASNDDLHKRQQKLLSNAAWPQTLVRQVDAIQSSEIAALPLSHGGLYFPEAGWVSPQAFCRAALGYLQQQSGFTFISGCEVQHIARQPQPERPTWTLSTTKGTLSASQIIWATGARLAELPYTSYLPLNKVRGQVSHIRQPAMDPLKTVICHKGYITPVWQGIHAVGATFDRHADTAFVCAADDAENIELVNQQLQQPPWFDNASAESAKAAFRATVPDHLPLLGSLQTAESFYLFGALGARGLLLAPLLAEVLACQLSQEPTPLDIKQLARLSPQRFDPA